VAATDSAFGGVTHFLFSASNCSSEREYKSYLKNKEIGGFRH
jgi:hypothetical protein